MSATLILALVLTLQTPSPPAQTPPPPTTTTPPTPPPTLPRLPTRRTDQMRLQGIWETTIPGPRPEVKVRMRMEVIRESFTWKLRVDDETDDRIIKGRFQLNTTKLPAHIDLNELNADGRSLPSLRAIYVIENNGKTLKILGPAGPDQPRPTRFTESDGSVPARLLVFQKQPSPELDLPEELETPAEDLAKPSAGEASTPAESGQPAAPDQPPNRPTPPPAPAGEPRGPEQGPAAPPARPASPTANTSEPRP